MKDIKTKQFIKQQNTVEQNKKVESERVIENKKSEDFRFGKMVFSSLCLSVFLYLFFVTSTIYYAVNTQKYASKIESINHLAVFTEDENFNIENLNNKKDKISFINKNSDTAISLK